MRGNAAAVQVLELKKRLGSTENEQLLGTEHKKEKEHNQTETHDTLYHRINFNSHTTQHNIPNALPTEHWL